MPRRSPRSWPIAAAASVSWPTTSPMTSMVAPPGWRNASYQSPPTRAASTAGRYRLAGGQGRDGDLGGIGLGRLGEQAPLQALRELLLLGVEARVVQRQPGPVGDVLGDDDVVLGRCVPRGVEEGEQPDGPAAGAQREGDLGGR